MNRSFLSSSSFAFSSVSDMERISFAFILFTTVLGIRLADYAGLAGQLVAGETQGLARYFLTYAGSLESNLMQMVLAKEKLTMFMKGQDADMDEIYAKFGVDYDLLSTLMTRETDDEGHLRIHWGEQKIA